MNRCHLSDRLDHQMLSPILGSIEQLIEILSGQLLCKATKSAFDGALEDHFLLVVIGLSLLLPFCRGSIQPTSKPQKKEAPSHRFLLKRL